MERDVHFPCKPIDSDEAVKKAAKKLEKMLEERDAAGDVPGESIVGICRVCRGKVVRETRKVFDPRSGPVIIGPGSLSQYVLVEHFYCKECGVKYEFSPPARPVPLKKRR